MPLKSAIHNLLYLNLMFLSNGILRLRLRMRSHSFSQTFNGIKLYSIVCRETKSTDAKCSLLNRNLSKESKMRKSDWIKLIREHTVISRDHLTPEIPLHLITPACQLWSVSGTESPFNDPFWAFYWPGGQALSRYILDNPSLVKNKTVLDFGCGSGACGIAATIAGAKSVIANDIDEIACFATELNADINDVNVITNSSNLVGLPISCDCIFVGDMFYDEEFASTLFKWLRRLHDSGKLVLIGDAGRLALKNAREREKLRSLGTVQLPATVKAENNGFSSAEIWSL